MTAQLIHVYVYVCITWIYLIMYIFMYIYIIYVICLCARVCLYIKFIIINDLYMHVPLAVAASKP